LFCHRFDPETPLEETCCAMNWAIEQGWAEYWGTSEWPAPMIMNAIGICDKLGLIRPVVEQVQYNMLVRARFEVEYGELFDNFKMGSTIWSPLAGGMLSGKYIDEIPNDSRVGKHPVLKDMYYTPHMGTEEKKKATVGILKGLKEFCKELGCTMSQLGIAWSLKNNDVSSCLIGVNNVF